MPDADEIHTEICNWRTAGYSNLTSVTLILLINGSWEEGRAMKQLILNTEVKRPLSKIWEFGVNTCHAPLWLRTDLAGQLKRQHEELGFRHIRFHDVFGDELGVVDSEGNFHFERVIQIYKNVLACGMKPFVELSSMPGALASGENHLCFYKFRSDPPTRWEAWRELIETFLSTLTDSFGEDEVKTWYFEVWNEPDLPFWSGDRDGYFRLYDLARNAIKSVSRSYRVGGPATSKTKWIPEFVAHVSKPSADDPDDGIRCDFISTHAYPSDLAFLNSAEGSVRLEQASVMRELYTAVRQVLDTAWGPDFPLFAGEWNSSAGPYAFNHDECNNAPFVCKTMCELRGLCTGSMYWGASDIYEEGGFHYAPFHGGYGLETVNSIPKAAYHAFRFLHDLGETELEAAFDQSSEEHGALATEQNGEIRVLVWNYRSPETAGEPLEFGISGAGNCRGTVERIEPGYGSAYETWRELGSPEFLDYRSFEKLAAASRTRREDFAEGETIFLAPGTVALLCFRHGQ